MLVVDRLRYGLPGRVLLDDVSAQFRSSEVTCLVGGNGSGKTTLFNLISGFLKPESGSISIDGTRLVGMHPYQISRLGVGRTFQDLRLIGRLSARNNILLALPNQPDERPLRALLDWAPSPNESSRRQVNAVLEEVSLAECAEKIASDLSYGQQKLLTLACCIATGAKVLLLDEPAAGLSPEYRKIVADLILKLKAAAKVVVVVEHQREFLERIGDSFLTLEKGNLNPVKAHSPIEFSRAAGNATA